MKYHDEESRRRWQNPEEILHRTGLGPGDTMIDVGCGEGFFTIPAARITGRTGRVIGIDINGDAVSVLMENAGREELGNVEGIVGSGEDVVVCDGCGDLIFFGIDLHDFRDPHTVLRNARHMIRPGGTLCNLDWQKRPTPFGPPVSIRFDEGTAADLIRDAGFSIRSIEEIPPWFYLITAIAENRDPDGCDPASSERDKFQ